MVLVTEHAAMPMRSMRERVIQTLSFEAGGMLLAVPLYAFFLGESGSESASLIACLSLAAMIWSPIHNCLFDLLDLKLSGRCASSRPHLLRLVHAASHEFTSCLVTVPIIMAISSFGFWQALAVDVGLTLLYTAYAYLFHIVFDRFRPVKPEQIVFP